MKRCKREPAESCLDRYARNNLDLAGNAGNDEYSCFFSDKPGTSLAGPARTVVSAGGDKDGDAGVEKSDGVDVEKVSSWVMRGT